VYFSLWERDDRSVLILPANLPIDDFEPTVTKLADDRAEQFNRESDKVAEEIRRRVREELRNRGDFAKIHPFAKSGEVSDEMETRLVVLDLDHPHYRFASRFSLTSSFYPYLASSGQHLNEARHYWLISIQS
jgi:hypothetical protein